MAEPSRQVLRRAARRMAEILGLRSFVNAGGTGKRWNGAGMRRPANAMLRAAPVSAARAAQLVANSPYGSAIRHAWVSNLVGDGPSARPGTRDKAQKAVLLAVWNRFWTDCDAEGLLAFDGLLQLAASSLVVAGEAFLHMSTDRNTGGLRLRLWSVDQVDRSMNSTGPGARIVAGVEFDATGRRVAYHVSENQDLPMGAPIGTRRVDAADVIHIFEPIFPGQVRGVSWFTPVATRLSEIDKLEDAQLAKHNTAALFGGVFTQPNAEVTKVFPTNEDGDLALEPGALIMAPPGYNIEFTSPPTADGAVEFLRAQLRSAAIGAGIPYELATGDLSQVNYSSARLGLMEFRRRVTTLQKSIFVARMLNPIWQRMLLLEGLAERLPMGLAMTATAEFIFSGWAPIDPLKETNADARAVDAGLKSRYEVIASRGRDPEEVDQEIAQDPRKPADAERIAA